MSNALVNLGERVASTFLFTFLASTPTAMVAFNASGLHAVEAGAAAGGIAAGQSLVKNLLAYFVASGNGPDASTPFVPESAPAPAPAAPVSDSVPASTFSVPAPDPTDLGADPADDSDGTAVDG